MQNQARVLVVTPTLGKSRWLDTTCRRVAEFCPRSLHVLAAPAPVVASLQARYPDCTVVADLGPAGGMYGAINAGVAAAAERDWNWFTYINDDDYFLPGFRDLLGLADSATADLLYGDVWYADEADGWIAPIPVERNPVHFKGLFRRGISPLVQQGTLVRRTCVERLGGFDTRYRLSSDLDFLAKAFVLGCQFQHAQTAVAAFRIQPGQLSGLATEMQAECLEIRQRLFPGKLTALEQGYIHATFILRNYRCYLNRISRLGFSSSKQIMGRGKTPPANH
jgi:hypothetical protein